MKVREVDPREEQAFSEWFAVVDAWQRDERPGEPGWLEHELRQAVLGGLQPDPDERFVVLAAYDDSVAVSAGRLDLPTRDNLHLAELILVTHPAHRRRAGARAVFEEAERRAVAEGRTTLVATSMEPPGTEGRSPGRGFGPAVGMQALQVEVRRDIDLPLDPTRVAALAAGAAEHAADYEVRTWRDAVPDDLLEDQAYLHRRMSTDVPTGEMDWQEEEWDAARVRREEQRVQAMDRTFFAAGAVHRPSGRLVAYTTMGIPRAAPERAYQWDTLVLTEHRGHRLGTLVKLAGLQRLSQEVPGARFISTWNAEENTPMIRVNDALGARVNGQLVNWQKKIG